MRRAELVRERWRPVHRLVEANRLQCLWFLREDYLPGSEPEVDRVLTEIEMRGDRQAWAQARTIRAWLSRTFNAEFWRPSPFTASKAAVPPGGHTRIGSPFHRFLIPPRAGLALKILQQPRRALAEITITCKGDHLLQALFRVRLDVQSLIAEAQKKIIERRALGIT